METDENGKPVLLYNRERRLRNAGPDALFAIAHHDGKRPPFLKALVATRSLRLMLVAMVACFAAVAVWQLTGTVRSRGTLGGAAYELQAAWFQGDIYLTLARQPSSRTSALPAVELVFEPEGRDAASVSMAAGQAELRYRLAAAERPARVGALVSGTDGELRLSAPLR